MSKNSQAKAYATRRNVAQADILQPRDQWRLFWANTLAVIDSPHTRARAQEYGQLGGYLVMVECIKELAK